MYFLGMFDKIAENAQGTVIDILRTVFYSINVIIYKLMIQVYKLFEILCHAKLLDNDVIGEIARRIGLVLGLVMFFYVAFSFVKMILDPDTIGDKSKGAVSIIKRVVIVLVLLGTSSYIFEITDDVQDYVLDSQVVEKVIFPWEVDTDNFGEVLSAKLFSSFYSMDERAEGTKLYQKCLNYWQINNGKIIEESDFEYGYLCLNEVVKASETDADVDIYVMDYNWFFSTIVGVVVVWMILMYAISIGMRAILLAVLQIIAPVAIISYLSPKQDGMFSKWLKKYVATYIDLFIRIAIVNLVVYLIAVVLNGLDFGSDSVLWTSINDFYASRYGGTEMPSALKLFLSVVIIIALLSFGKKAPELLKDLLPTSGVLSYGISAKERPGLGMFAKGAGIVGGGAIAMGGAAAIGGLSYFKTRNKKLGSFDKKSKDELAAMSAGDRKKYMEDLRKRRTALALSTLSGAVTGAGRGFVGGAKKGNVIKNVKGVMDNQMKANDVYDELIMTGGTPFGKTISKITNVLGETKGQEYQRKLNDLDKLDSYYSSMKSAADEIACVKDAKNTWENAVQQKGESIEAFEKRKSLYQMRYKTLRNFAIELSLGEVQAVDDKGELRFDKVSGKPIMQQVELGFSRVFKYKDENGEDKEFEFRIVDDDDKMQTFDVESIATQAETYRDDHKVQKYDVEHNVWKDVESLSSRKAFSETSNDAHMTKTAITSKNEYREAIANDKAAGVNSNKNNNK